jgi:tol-pal system protein YbgF
MATRVVVIWVLSLAVFWSAVFTFFQRHFDSGRLEKQHVAILERKLHAQLREEAKLAMNFNEYKDAIVAAGVKINDRTKWTDDKRMIASVMADPEFKPDPRPDFGDGKVREAGKLYAAGDYKRAGELLENFVETYPDHPKLPEAYYLLSESYFNTDQYEQSVKSIDFLVTHFPETEYAGYGLLRLGKIFERRERPEDAADTYKSIVEHFPKSNAAAMASKSLKDLNL